MQRTIRLALAQYQVAQGDPSANLQKLQDMTARAAAQGADLVCLPELCNTGYHLKTEQFQALAEPQDGPFAQMLSALALQHGIAIVAGYCEQGEIPGLLYNSALFVDRAGGTVGNVRKVYLWGKEKTHFRSGEHYPVFDTPLGRIGILLCYDAEFPEPSRILALKGAELVLVPSVWSRRAARRWEVELAANALFNLMFVAGANTVDENCCGTSQVVAPDGVVLAAASPTGEELLVCDLDLTQVVQTRARIPYFNDLRPDTFSMDALTRY